MIEAHYILIGLWAAYFAAHSLLASNKVKKLVGNQQAFRLVYSLISAVGLLAIFLYQATIKSPDYFHKSQLTQIIGLTFGIVCVLLVKQVFKHMSAKAFIGISKEENPTLITTGIYKRLRHPLYTAALSFGIGYFVFSPNQTVLLMLICWMAYLPIGIWLEEKKLISQFGNEYCQYQQKTKAILPGIL
ncbi:MAG: isoprenylcysteine carboxylmethyltransferase family protein [Bacteroidetes bacterium]|nr:isoprenylcysteine carboxylmethyltransferase family protein [Bacteroidota bacterium]